MAKKYLLYIHHSEFEEEEKKSELVNDLLSIHYGEGDSHIKSIINGRPIAKRIGNNNIQPVLKNLREENCVHGAGKGYCRYSKCTHSMFNPKNKA